MAQRHQQSPASGKSESIFNPARAQADHSSNTWSSRAA